MISIHSFKEPLSSSVSFFPSQTDDCPSEFTLGCAGWQVGEGRRRWRAQQRHFKAHHLVKAGCFSRSPSPFFTLECLVCLSSEVGLLRLSSSQLAALSVVESSDVLLVLLNLLDRACWPRPSVSACNEAGI